MSLDKNYLYTCPSLTAYPPSSVQIYEMEYKNGKCTVILTGSNNMLSVYRVSVSGNTLPRTSTKSINDAVTVK